MDQYIAGTIIKRLRKEKNMTQAELAEILSVSDKTVSKWETGKGYPDITLIEPIAEAMGISTIELLSGSNITNKNRASNMLRYKIYVCPICGNVIVSIGEAALKPGIYTLQDVVRDVPGDFTITIYEDGTFQCYETPISSYLGMGSYSIKKDVVILKEDEEGGTWNVNYYHIVNGNLVFIQKGSANYHFVPLEDGALFSWTSEL